MVFVIWFERNLICIAWEFNFMVGGIGLDDDTPDFSIQFRQKEERVATLSSK